MILKISRSELKNLVEKYTYKNEGDLEERKHENAVIDLFSNSEKFWKFFVTPSTGRMPGCDGSIMARNPVSAKIKEMSEFHYSIFYILFMQMIV